MNPTRERGNRLTWTRPRAKVNGCRSTKQGNSNQFSYAKPFGILCASMFSYRNLDIQFLTSSTSAPCGAASPYEGHDALWVECHPPFAPEAIAVSPNEPDPHDFVVCDWLAALMARTHGLRLTKAGRHAGCYFLAPLLHKPVDSAV